MRLAILFALVGVALSQKTLTWSGFEDGIVLKYLGKAGNNHKWSVTGPASTWFGVGFGERMSNSRAIIFSSGKSHACTSCAKGSEWQITAKSTSGLTTPSKKAFTITKTVKSGETATVTFQGPLKYGSGFTSTPSSSSVPIIWALGSSLKLAYHESRAARKISLASASKTTTTTKKPTCTGGRVYSSCASICVNTCKNPRLSQVCLALCKKGCTCPKNKPIWNEGKCIKYSDCEGGTTKKPKTCPKNCMRWYDGCNTCGCKNGVITACTRKWCLITGKAYCTAYHTTKKPAGEETGGEETSESGESGSGKGGEGGEGGGEGGEGGEGKGE